mmetsp:Transcript_103584/g.293228  ORF Transcript_103584/g.293228 Transcript_103584/m.293228 type:complete len:263 (+) Transcript_103584:1205-1993(+)
MSSFGYISPRNASPRASALSAPACVSSPPHLRPTANVGPLAQTFAWQSMPSSAVYFRASSSVSTSWPADASSRAALASRSSWCGQRSSSVSGGDTASAAPAPEPTIQAQSHPARNSDFSRTFTFTFCFGVLSPCRATRSTHSSWSSSSPASETVPRCLTGAAFSSEDVSREMCGWWSAAPPPPGGHATLHGGGRHGVVTVPSWSSSWPPSAFVSAIFGEDLDRFHFLPGARWLRIAAKRARATSLRCAPRPPRGMPVQTSMT